MKIKCPAKINLDLKVYDKDENGFHNIKSIMQTINLFDYITLNLIEENKITLTGTSDEIPYNEKNLCYKAADYFFEKINYQKGVDIFIEKNIPVEAGLAGGSTDAAGVLFGLNKLLNNPLSKDELFKIAQNLGSDISFCLKGGTVLCQGKGDKLTPMPFYNFKLALIKPKNLKISAKEAYETYDNTKEMSDMRNDLEFALLKTGKYKELEYLSSLGFQMSGSGPTYFVRDKNINDKTIDKNQYLIINDLNSVEFGVQEV